MMPHRSDADELATFAISPLAERISIDPLTVSAEPTTDRPGGLDPLNLTRISTRSSRVNPAGFA
jgi:hypothetical protein